jgi:dethiobiotin synthetase
LASPSPERFSLFVTGTDTGVGKTFTTAAIAALAVASGRSVTVIKPVQTGVLPREPGDIDVVRHAVGPTPLLRTEEPYRFKAPLAPSVAVRLEGTAIDPPTLVRRCREVTHGADIILVEGAGGLLVPLANHYLMADLARELRLALLVVTRPGLGTLNHTALTVEAARSRKLETLGLVISGYPAEPDVAAETNPRLLVEMTGLPLLGVLPWVPGLSTGEVMREAFVNFARSSLAPALGGEFDAERFLDARDSSRIS